MILKTFILALILDVAWWKGVSGASYSKVFVQSGPEVHPLGYVEYEYGAPSVSLPGPHIAQLTAAPLGSVVPVASVPNVVTPCGTPCVYPGQPVGSISPSVPNYITYKSNVPVIVQNNNEPAPGYEYSYFVYDENTGDHKLQRELSDGTVVRGEYSLLQPDGYVREVQYTADDLKGFNAIVKKFLPVTVEKKIEQNEKKLPPPPCTETKNEPLKESASLEQLTSEGGGPEQPNEEIRQETPIDESLETPVEKNQESSSEENPDKSSVDSNESSSEQSREKSSEELSQEKPSEESQSEKLSEALIEMTTKSHEETSSEQSEEAPHELQTEKTVNEIPESKPSNEDISQEIHQDVPTEVAAQEILETSVGHEIAEANVLVPYNDILKCVQAAVSGVSGVPASQKSESPLTYIILNKPC